jgi:hypothetical protein
MGGYKLMKNFLSFTIFAALFLGLGVLALTAAPTQLSSIAGSAPNVTTSTLDANTAANSFNYVAIPLDASGEIDPFTASGLAVYQGSSVQQVLKWNAGLQTFDSYKPGVSPPFADFAIEVGGAYFLEVDSTSSDVFSIVGDVPDQGTIDFSLTKGPAPDDCYFNSLSIPLDRSDLTKASELANDVGGVDQVLNWNASSQTFDSYSPGISPPFADFDVAIGYPYFVCLDDSAPANWP